MVERQLHLGAGGEAAELLDGEALRADGVDPHRAWLVKVGLQVRVRVGLQAHG